MQKILNLAKPSYHRAKHVFNKIWGSGKNKKSKLVFVFQGWSPSRDWAIQFYKNDVRFKEIIIACNALLVEFGGPEVLTYFEGAADERFFNNALTSARFVLSQIAIVKLLGEKGIYPNAVFGTSMGVFAAGYASGATTLEDTLKLSIAFGKVGELDNGRYYQLFIALDFSAANELASKCPVWMEIVYQDSPNSVVAMCQQEGFDELEFFFKKHEIKWKVISKGNSRPYHTSRMKPYREQFIAMTKGVLSQPLRCDFFCDVNVSVLLQNSIIDGDLWFDTFCKPSFFSETLQLTLNRDLETFVQIGPSPITARRLGYVDMPYSINLINTDEH